MACYMEEFLDKCARANNIINVPKINQIEL